MRKLRSRLKILWEVIREVFLINFWLTITLFGCCLLFLLTVTIGPSTCRKGNRHTKRLSEVFEEDMT